MKKIAFLKRERNIKTNLNCVIQRKAKIIRDRLQNQCIFFIYKYLRY